MSYINNSFSGKRLPSLQAGEVQVNQTFQHSEPNLYRFKLIMLGDVAVGKTSIMNRFVDNEFKSAYDCTIGVEYKVKKIKVDQITGVELKIWDTCGAEKYRAITRQYYRDTHGVVLVFDLTNRATFDKVNVWLKDLRDNGLNDICCILVGNKTDIKERNLNLSDEARRYAIKNKMPYIEVSAKLGTNVASMFENITKKIVNKWKETNQDNDEEISNEQNKNMNFGLVRPKVYQAKKTNNIKIEKKSACC